MHWCSGSNCLIFIFLFFYSKTNADEVPTILWNIKGDALSIRPISALEQDDRTFIDNVENLINEKANIIVFSINQLSLEDFSASDQLPSANNTIQNLQKFLDTTPYVLMSSVSSPLTQLHNVHCGVQEIVVDQKIDENVMQSVSLAFGQSCIVILHITDTEVFSTKDTKPEDIKNVFLPTFSNSPENVVGIFTSDKASWSASNSEHHIFRNILQADEEDPHFINITGCVYMYVENATVQVGKGNNTVILPLPPDTKGSSCTNGTVLLQLAFEMSGDITSVVVNFNFKNEMGSWVTDTTIEVTGKDAPVGELPAYSDFLEAPMKYSFNCGNLKLKTKNKTDVIVTMTGFQVQPFPVGDKFSSSFDCVTFFTIPIWMGIFVSFLFIVIINIGIYALFSVHTMDRFDDPKGKTITVAVSGD